MTLYGIDRLKAAKIKMLNSHPFYGSLAVSLPLELEDDSKKPDMTAYTDGLRIVFGKNFLEKQSKEELIFIYGHELTHVVLSHPSRGKHRVGIIWNIAIDYVTNSILVKDNVGVRPKWTLYDEQYENMSAEEIYRKLIKNVDLKSIKFSPDGFPLDDEGIKRLARDLGISEDKLRKMMEEGKHFSDKKMTDKDKEVIESAVARAKNIEKNIGKQSLAINEAVGGIVKTDFDWQSILASYLSRDDVRYSYRHLNRKYVGNDIYLPTKRSDKLKINIALDVSGSISDEELRKFFGDVFSILSMTVNAKEIRLFQVDTEVLYDKEITDGETTAEEIMVRHGSGGTDFTKLFEKLKNEGNTDLLVLFTDGYAEVPKKAPQFPLITVTTSKKLPYGDTIYYGSGENEN